MEPLPIKTNVTRYLMCINGALTHLNKYLTQNPTSTYLQPVTQTQSYGSPQSSPLMWSGIWNFKKTKWLHINTWDNRRVLSDGLRGSWFELFVFFLPFAVFLPDIATFFCWLNPRPSKDRFTIKYRPHREITKSHKAINIPTILEEGVAIRAHACDC